MVFYDSEKLSSMISLITVPISSIDIIVSLQKYIRILWLKRIKNADSGHQS